MQDPLHRRFARAALITTLNPFAQLARLGQRPSGKRYLRSEADISAPFKKLKLNQNDAARPYKKPRTVPTGDTPRISAASPALVTPKKASKPVVVNITPKKKPIRVELKKPMSRVVEDIDESMDSSESEVQAQASRAMAPSSGGMVKETPITRAVPEYGLPSTHTAILPYTTYFSVICNDAHSDPAIRFQFRLNSIIDPVVTTPTVPTASAAFAAGIFNQPVTSGPNATTWPATARAFPRTLGAAAAEAAQYQNWFTAMYRYYTVLGCEYTITVMNARQRRSSNIAVATYIDTFSANNNSQIHPTGATMADMEHWPDVRFYQVDGTGEADNFDTRKTIQGQYKTGAAFRNVENDEDVRTWTRTNVVPAYQENMTIAFARSWMNDWVDELSMALVRVQLRYIVQFKDLITPFRWPAGQTTVNFAVPDLLQQNA